MIRPSVLFRRHLLQQVLHHRHLEPRCFPKTLTLLMLSRVPSFLAVFLMIPLVASDISLFPGTLSPPRTAPGYLLLHHNRRDYGPPRQYLFIWTTLHPNQPAYCSITIILTKQLSPTGTLSIATTHRHSPPQSPTGTFHHHHPSQPLTGTLLNHRVRLPHKHLLALSTTTTNIPGTTTLRYSLLHHHHHPGYFSSSSSSSTRYHLPSGN